MLKPHWICLLLLAVSSTVFAKNQFVIVIDAGSSGSRAHLFSYDDANKAVNMNEVTTAEVGEPLAQQPAESIKQLQTILLNFKERLRQSSVKAIEVPVYLNATAGMRLVPEAKQRAIYNSVMQSLPATGFDVREARTISGEDEGTFDWVSVNYLTTHGFHAKVGETIDMGGASMQLTTVDSTCAEGDRRLDMNQQQYCIKPVSYLGLGSDQAAKHSASDACYPTGYQFEDGRVAVYDHNKCRLGIDAFLDGQSVKGAEIPNDVNIDAVSSIYYTVDFFKAYAQEGTDAPKQTSITRLKQQVKALCQGQDWSSWKAQFGAIPEKFLKNYCFNGVYLERLMASRHGFGLAEQRTFRVWSKIRGQDAGWPLGAAIYYVFVSH